MIDINELTLGQIKEIQAMNPRFPLTETNSSHPFEIGKNYFIRTVTHHLTGRLVSVGNQELVLESAAWIADDGRFADALKSCKFEEVEPFPGDNKVVVGRGSIIDVTQIETLPKSQK